MALAEPPPGWATNHAAAAAAAAGAGAPSAWLSSEVMGLFHFHSVPKLSVEEHAMLLPPAVRRTTARTTKARLALRRSHASTVRAQAAAAAAAQSKLLSFWQLMQARRDAAISRNLPSSRSISIFQSSARPPPFDLPRSPPTPVVQERTDTDPSLAQLQLSTRALLRAAAHARRFPGDVGEAVRRASSRPRSRSDLPPSVLSAAPIWPFQPAEISPRSPRRCGVSSQAGAGPYPSTCRRCSTT